MKLNLTYPNTTYCDNKYFQAAAPLRAAETQPPLLLLRPNSARTTYYTHRLHLLTNLNKIPIEDIEKIFNMECKTEKIGLTFNTNNLWVRVSPYHFVRLLASFC